jgi:AcrR family transcriptional regulator
MAAIAHPDSYQYTGYLHVMPVKTRSRSYRSEIRKAAADETRARILASAHVALTGGKGSPAFSLDAVAREAAVTRLTVYNQFGSRLGLLEAVFDDLAQQGGLSMQLPAALDDPDPRQALRRTITAFCEFWATHRKAMPRLLALTAIDQEFSASLRLRRERRRDALHSLVERWGIGSPAARGDLVDTLFALTSFEMYDALAVKQRSRESIDALLQQLAEDTVRRYESRAGSTARDKKRSMAR